MVLEKELLKALYEIKEDVKHIHESRDEIVAAIKDDVKYVTRSRDVIISMIDDIVKLLRDIRDHMK